MSKVTLRKELKNLDRDQLASLVEDIYNVSKEAKRYLEFFLNPDEEKLKTETRQAIQKEFGRYKRGTSKARFSEINNILKEYEAYGVGTIATLNMMTYALNIAFLTEWVSYVPAAFHNGMTKLTSKIIEYGDKNMLFDTAVEKVNDLLGHHQISEEAQFDLRHGMLAAMDKIGKRAPLR